MRNYFAPLGTAFVLLSVALFGLFGPKPILAGPVARKALLKLQGHDRPITAVAFSPNGKLLASAGRDGRICLWNAVNGERLHRHMAHKGGAYAVAFSLDGKRLASSGEDRLIRCWDVATGRALRQLEGHQGAVPTLAFAPDGKTLASGSYDGTIRFWDTATGKERHQWRAHKQRVTCVAYAPDGKSLFSGGVHDWDYVAGGNNIIHCGRADLLHQWEAESGNLISKLGVRGYTLTLSADNGILAAGETGPHMEERNGRVSINGFDKFSLVDRLSGETRTVKWQGCAVAFSPDCQVLVSACGYPPSNCGLAHTSPSPENRKVADTRIQFWEIATGKRVLRLLDDDVIVLAFSPDGMAIATGKSDGAVLLWFLPLAEDDAAPRLQKEVPAPKDLKEPQLARLWYELGHPHAPTAYQATWKLTAAPAQLVALLKERLKPDSPAKRKQLRQLLADLDAKRFSDREAATDDLRDLGIVGLPALRHALVDAKSLEARRRLLGLLEKLKGEMPASESELVRQVRAVQVLERIGTAEARQLLKELADDPPLTWQSGAAAGALRRLQGRSQP